MQVSLLCLIIALKQFFLFVFSYKNIIRPELRRQDMKFKIMKIRLRFYDIINERLFTEIQLYVTIFR